MPDPQADLFEVWPENETALRLFLALETQWRVVTGINGIRPLGIDYAAVPTTLALMGVKRREWPDLFNDLRVMEAAALNEFSARRAAAN